MTTTMTPRPIADRDVRSCQAAGEHQHATRHTRAECDAHAAAVAVVTAARNDAWGRVLEAEPGTPEHGAEYRALAAARDREARVRAGEAVTLPGLTLRTDGRYEVHDTAAANAEHGCPADTECILARWHDGPCCEDREHDAHADPRTITTTLPGTVQSRVVPTEYDVETDAQGRVVLVDDRSRRFTGSTVAAALARAERSQDPADPIHHPPYPSPAVVPAPRDLSRVSLTKTGADPAAPWALWVPHTGPLVEHVPFIDRYDVGVYTSDADLTDDDRAARDDAPLMGAFGTTYWPEHADAVEVLRGLERQYPRPVTTPSS